MKFKWYIWIPRVLIIVIALFMMLFSLDILEMKLTFWMKLLGLLVHNLPSLILFIILLFTWKRPFWAGLIFLFSGISLSVIFYVFFRKYSDIDFLLFAFPVLMCGILFITAHYDQPKSD